MKFTKLKVIWRFELAKCKLFLSLDFEKHNCFFYFSGSGEPSRSEMHNLELLIHTYDNFVGELPKTGLSPERAYWVEPHCCRSVELPIKPSSEDLY